MKPKTEMRKALLCGLAAHLWLSISSYALADTKSCPVVYSQLRQGVPQTLQETRFIAPTIFRDDFNIGGLQFQDRIIPKTHHEIFRVHGFNDPDFPDVMGDFARVKLYREPISSKAPDLATAERTAPENNYSPVERLEIFRQFTKNQQVLQSGSSMDDGALDHIVYAFKGNENDPQISHAVLDFERSLDRPIENNPYLALTSKGSLARSKPVALLTEAQKRNPLSPGTSVQHSDAAVPRLGHAPVDDSYAQLASAGAERYFWFKPQGTDQLVPARVLDIHTYSGLQPEDYMSRHNGSISVLAEWYGPGPNGEVQRHVGSITQQEIKSIARTSAEGRAAAAQEIRDQLTPLEHQTLQLASKFKMEPRGYADFRRAPGVSGGSFSPQERMTADFHVVLKDSVSRAYGGFDDLLTPQELANRQLNVLDVFSRMDPESVLRRFPPRPGTRHIWLVTEDGQLRIAPLGESLMNLRPPLLRLGHGRKIFAAGELSGTPNDLKITLRSDSYWSADARIAGQTGHLGQNNEVNNFVNAVFNLQADQWVSSIDAVPTEGWSYVHFNPVSGRYEFDGATEGSFSRRASQEGFGGSERKAEFKNQYGGFESKEQKDWFASLFKAPSDGKIRKLEWDYRNKGQKPLTFQEWLGQAISHIQELKGKAKSEAIDRASRDSNYRQEWAHYVLGTSKTSTYKDIKNKYRHIAAIHHPRVEGDSDVVSKIVNEAYEIVNPKRQ